MPNWVHNYLKATGAAEEIARFKQTCIRDGEIDFNTLIPRPAGIGDDDPSGITGNNWACENWGTKWNACYSSFGDEDDGFVYRFSTAWSVPVPVFEKLGEMFPALEFELSGSEMLNDMAYEGSIEKGRVELRKVPLIHEVTDGKTGETRIRDLRGGDEAVRAARQSHRL